MPFEEVWSCNALPPTSSNACVQTKTTVEITSPFNQICSTIRGKSSEAARKALEHFGEFTIETASSANATTASAEDDDAQSGSEDDDDESSSVAAWMPIMHSVPLEIRAELLKIVKAIDIAFLKMTKPAAAVREQGGKEFAKLLYESKESYLLCMAKIREKTIYERTPEQQMYIKEALSHGEVAGVGLGGSAALERLIWLASHPQELEQKLQALTVIDSAPARVRSSMHGGRTSVDKDLSREHSKGHCLLKELHDEIQDMAATGKRGLPPSIIQEMARVLLEQGPYYIARQTDPEAFQNAVKEYFPQLLDSKYGLTALFSASTRLSRNPFELVAFELKRSDNIDGIQRLCEQIKTAAAQQDVEYLDRNNLKISARTMLRWVSELEDKFLIYEGAEFQFNTF
jgi:hypothetical protein